LSTFLGERALHAIQSEDDIRTYFESFIKPYEAIRVGIEVEFFGVERDSGKALPYEGPRGIHQVLELMAAIVALESLKRSCKARLTTDSQYVKKGITEWLPRWKSRGWKTADKKPVKNVDLWQRLDVAVGRHDVEWHWVRGHTGHDGNERADELANRAIDELVR